MARKVVGVGSVGTRCWIVLMLGRDDADPLFLQVKEAEASVLSRFVGASKYANQGQRVVAGQRLMQASSDIFLGWQRTEAGSTAGARLLRPPAAGLEVLRRHRAMRPAACELTASSAAGRWPGRMPAPATASPSPPTWAARTSSTGPSPSSPRPTPTRTSATTSRSSTRSAGRITAEAGVRSGARRPSGPGVQDRRWPTWRRPRHPHSPAPGDDGIDRGGAGWFQVQLANSVNQERRRHDRIRAR